MGTKEVVVKNLMMNTTYDLQCRAVGPTLHSDWSPSLRFTTIKDDQPPKKPSTLVPDARLGVITLFWDGKDFEGNDMEGDFNLLKVFMGDGPDVSTSDTLVDSVKSSGYSYVSDQPYNTLRYFTSVVVDQSGNESPQSDVVAIATKPLVDTDIIAQAISGANIKNGTIVASDKIFANSITSGQIAALAITAGKISANAIEADNIQAGAITAVKISVGAVTADKISGDVISGRTIFGANIYGGTFRTGPMNTTAYYRRVEIGDVGGNDPVDEIRMINGGLVSSIRNPSYVSGDTYSGTGGVKFSLQAPDGLAGAAWIGMSAETAYYSSTGSYQHHLIIGKGANQGQGGPKFKFLENAIQVRSGSDNFYAGFTPGSTAVQGNLTATGSITANVSLSKYKNEITPLIPNNSEILRTNGLHSWRWNSDQQEFHLEEMTDEFIQEINYGLIADDMPDWMRVGEGYSYTAIIAFLWGALREAYDRIEALEERE